MPSRLSSVGGYVPPPPASFPPLVGPPEACRRHFCARVHHGRAYPKTQDHRKGHLNACHGVLYHCGYPYIPAPQNGPHKPPEARAGHKSTPARSTRSKPGYYHLFRARESTAQRSLSASHQAQEPPLHRITPSSIDARPQDAPRATTRAKSINGHSRWSSRVLSIVVASKKSFYSCLLPESP